MSNTNGCIRVIGFWLLIGKDTKSGDRLTSQLSLDLKYLFGRGRQLRRSQEGSRDITDFLAFNNSVSRTGYSCN